MEKACYKFLIIIIIIIIISISIYGWKYIFTEEDILPFAMRYVTLLLEYFSSLVEVFLCAATAHAEMSLRTDYVCENNQMVSG